MLVRAKERKELIFQELKVGEVFKANDGAILMKVRFEDDCICCPRCDMTININDEKIYAVELNSGLMYEFDEYSTVEIIQGAFIEE